MDTFENRDDIPAGAVPGQTPAEDIVPPAAAEPELPPQAAAPEQTPAAAIPAAEAEPASAPQAQAVPPVYTPPAPPESGYYHYIRPENGQYFRPQPGYAPPPPPPPKPPKKKHRVLKTILCAILILALVGGSCCATAWFMNRQWEAKTDEMQSSLNSQLAELQAQIEATALNNNNSSSHDVTLPVVTQPTADAMTPAQVYARNVQAVVAISSTVTTTYYGQETTGTSTGSGFIVTADGYVVTNYHVVEDASAISVTTNSGEVYSATYIGGDSNNDVAVLKVEAAGLPTVTIGSSDDIIVGDQVVAIGNPLGELTNTLTVGYVSAKDRAVTTDSFAINMLQTDAAINSGNSGGPLFNMYGQVIGITSAKYSGESSSGATIEGIGFAIPINDVIDLIEDLINDGVISSGYLGVSVSDYVSGAYYASYYGLPEDAPTGAIVREVVAGYCAEAAGIRNYDIVVEMGGYTVTGVTSLTRALRNFRAGDTTSITVYRDGELLVLPITLDERPEDLEQETTIIEETEPETEATQPGGFGGGFPGKP